ncbi:MAG TPA: hypothetical protein VI320_34975 [Terracidiphilus sp.]|jgi:hypothetical protein
MPEHFGPLVFDEIRRQFIATQVNQYGEQGTTELRHSPKTFPQNVIYPSLCLSPIFFHHALFVDAVIAEYAVVVVAVILMMLIGRGACWY